MQAGKRTLAVLAFVLLASCGGGLPRALRTSIRAEKDNLQAAQDQLRRSEEAVQKDLSQSPDLFRGAAVATEWPAQLRNARQELQRAETLDGNLDVLANRHTREDLHVPAESLLSQERSLREAAVRDAAAVETAANRWTKFEHNVPGLLDNLKEEYAAVRAVDLSPAETAVAKAEQDWPAKKADLESRLASLKATPESVESKWRDTTAARQDAASGKASAAEIATLIQADDEISQAAAGLPKKAEELRSMSAQLYNSWDKILADLEVSRSGPQTLYREKLKTVQTHFADATAKTGATSSSTAWLDVPEPSYRAVENDLGMTIAHKDAGRYDSEAQTTPEPPGFAYMAPPSQGSNRYGYWSDRDGSRVWTWLPEYLIMRDLLWGHNYRPVIIDEYNGYRTAQSSGHTYYGKDTPAAPPRYGSHGTFTQKTYASSRYVQSGGFRGSGYASGGGSYRPSEARGRTFSENPSAGRGFGSGSASGSASGRRFGSGASGSPGRRFGASPRSPARGFGRSFGRGFGRHR